MMCSLNQQGPVNSIDVIVDCGRHTHIQNKSECHTNRHNKPYDDTAKYF